ncbi:MAG: hypothetical protein ABFC94_06680 [Syntrophomonas sp.]
MIALISRLLGSVFTLKFFMSGVMMTILAVVLYNLCVTTIQEVFNFAIEQIGQAGIGSVSIPSITGFAGWFLAQVKLPECLSVMVSAISIKFILRKIPFLKW